MNRRRLSIALGLLLLLGGAAAFVGPPLVARWADRTLRARLERAGVGGHWARLSWSLDAGLALEGVTLWRGATRFTSERVTIQVSPRSALLGRPRVTALSIGPWQATVAAPEAAPGDAPTSGGAPPVDQAKLAELLESAPALAIAAGRVTVTRAEAPIGALQVDAVEVAVSAAGVSAAATGTAEVDLPGITPGPWRAELRWDPVLEAVGLAVEAEGDGPLLTVRHGPLDGSIGGATLTIEAGRAWVTARTVAGHAGPLTGSVREARVARRLGAWALTLVDGQLTLAGDVAAAPDAPTAEAAVEPSAIPVEPPLPIHVEDVDVDVTFRGRRLVGHLRAAAVEGSRWTASAEFGGGAVTAELDLIPGTLAPRQLTLRLDEVDTEELQQTLRRNWRRPFGRRAALAGRLSGVVTLLAPPEWPEAPIDPEGPLWLEAQLELDDGIIDWDGVHDAPIGGIDGRAAVSARWTPDHALRLVAQVGHRALRGYVAFDLLRLDDAPRAELVVAVDPIDCQSALDALPRALLGPYAGVRASGHITPWLEIKVPLDDPVGTQMNLQGLLGRCRIDRLDAAREAWPEIEIAGRRVDDPATARIDDVGWLYEPFVMTVREGTTQPVQVGPGLDSYVPLTSLPEYVGAAAYLSEEMEFYSNGAVSPGLILRALRLNLERGRFVYGGSTVTQQLVKNLFLSRGKTLVRKFREAIVAGRIVDEVSKDRVLELYLNCIEFGPNVYGIGPAARFYFQKDARDLSPKEAVFLAMLKPAPYQGRMMMRRGFTANYPWWNDRYALLMQRLVERGVISAEEAEAERPYLLFWKEGEYLGSKTAVRDPYREDEE